MKPMEMKTIFIPGCYEIVPSLFFDERGCFVKTFNRDKFLERGLATEWKEEYYSVSKQRVLRGLHFQLPPYEHEKLVYCVAGCVLDVVVDLRIDSPTYGEHALFELNSDKKNMVYIPRGMAHGFYVLSDTATMLYKVTSVFAPEHDSGIYWRSVGVAWPDDNPVISTKDSQLMNFNEFKSPFVRGTA